MNRPFPTSRKTQGANWRMAAAFAFCMAVFMGAAHAASLSDLYVNPGVPSLGSLAVSPSATVNIDTKTSGGAAPTLTVVGIGTYTGVARDYGQGEVAIFYFDYVEVPDGTTVTVTGQRPLSIVSANDMIWGASINAPPGMLGGGTRGSRGSGSAGGGGGAGGAGGAGGSGGGGGGGGENDGGGRTYGGDGGAGGPGIDGQPGSPGVSA
ncbi:MAG TPA: hypothetical protein PK967_15755, partial [Candidatus Hydrogenedentes bacterium]|nr:hypothetical protein [Candidatus Hydrogenedentota bacterium]